MRVLLSWLKEYVDYEISPEELAKAITMGGVEVEEIISYDGDSILELAPTPNRGDCLSMIGVAKEVAALINKKVKLPKVNELKGKKKLADFVNIKVNDKKGCKRYTSRIVNNVKIGPSPEWLVKRLDAAGIRSINNIVDATNYILLEYGQPVHAFDLELLEGNALIIDRPNKKCKLPLLDDVEYEFTPHDILNFDAKKPIGAAGIMGGGNSGVNKNTKTLVLESAYFDPITVRKTSKRIGLASESSKRFEKGVDPDAVIVALHRLTELIVELAEGEPSIDWIDIYPNKIERKNIDLNLKDIERLLGIKLALKKITKILKSIGCNVNEETSHSLKVLAPSGRPDLLRSIDLVEEVARLYGYANIPDSMPVIKASSLVKPTSFDSVRLLTNLMASIGFNEVKTYSFVSKESLAVFDLNTSVVELANPLTHEMGCMRPSLLPSLLDVLENNLRRQNENIKIFEINSTFFSQKNNLPKQIRKMAGAMIGTVNVGRWDQPSVDFDLFDAKAVVWAIFDRIGLKAPSIRKVQNLKFMHPGESFEIFIGKKNLGYCGRLHPNLEKQRNFPKNVYFFELDLQSILEILDKRDVKYSPVSRFPFMERDIALLVDSLVTHEEIMQTFNKKVNNLVQSIELFDIYVGRGIPEGKKSLAYRLKFGSFKRTLKDDEVDKEFHQIVEFVKKEVNATIR